jgi:hypothetical protein
MVGLRETKSQALHPVRDPTRTESVAGDAAQVLQMRLGAGRPSEQRDNCLLLSWTRHVPEFWRRIKLRCLLESVHENVGCLLGTPARLIWGDWRESKSEIERRHASRDFVTVTSTYFSIHLIVDNNLEMRQLF